MDQTINSKLDSLLAIALLSVTVLLIAGCAQVRPAPQSNNIEVFGSGNLVSRSIALPDIDTVEAGLIFDLSIRQGEQTSIKFIADDNWIDFLDAKVDDMTLSLKLQDGYAYNFNNVTMRAIVTLPELAELKLNGSSQATLAEVKDLETFTATLTGSSHLDGRLAADNVDLQLEGNSTIQLVGSSDQLTLAGCGYSLADLKAFKVTNAELNMACNSTAVVQVDGRLAGEAAQNSQLFYVGQPTQKDIKIHQFAHLGQQ